MRVETVTTQDRLAYDPGRRDINVTRKLGADRLE